MRTLLFTLLASLVIFAAHTLPAEDFTEGLIARWTFNRPGSDALVDDIHQIAFEERALPGSPTAVTVNGDGTITLAAEQFLVADGLNSDKYPELKEGVTIWARLRIDSAAPNHTSFVYGLLQKPRGDWKDATLTLVHRAQGMAVPGLSFFGQVNGMEFGPKGESLEDHSGSFITTALSFDGAEQKIALSVDQATTFNKKQGATALMDFSNFSVGRITAAGEISVTIDEIRIYSSAVSPDWLSEIKPVSPDKK